MKERSVIEAKGLVKKFDEKAVVNKIELEIYRGECFGILGPNGAGKSSLLKMMYCSSKVTAGELYVLGLNVKKNFREIKGRIGVIPQDDGLDTDFSVIENLEVFARYFELSPVISQKRINDLLKMVRLDERKNDSIDQLSGGMRRRLAIARGMVNNPELIFMDEPTSGLDPQARLWIWDFLKKIKSEMGTVVLTTHYMEEAEHLCDRIAIMDHGQILAIGSPKVLVENQIGREVVDFECSQSDLFYYTNRLKEKNYHYNVIRNTVSVYLPQSNEGKKVLDFVSSQRVTVRKPTLNDVFLKIAGHELREDIHP